MSNDAVDQGGSAKERPSRAWGEGGGRGWEARSVVFYEGLRLWEAHLYVFYEDLRLWEVVLLTKLCGQVGPLKKDPHGRGGRGRGVGDLGSL